MKLSSNLILSAFALLLGCGEASHQSSPTQKLSLSTDAIQIVKTSNGQVSTDFDACVFEDKNLVSHLGLPEDTYVSKNQRGHRCFITLQRSDLESDEPYANFHTTLTVAFNGYIFRNPTELAEYIDLYYKNPVRLSGYGDETYAVAGLHKDSEAIIGFHPGGSYYLDVRSKPVMRDRDGPPISAIYEVDKTLFRDMAANLNSRLRTDPTID